MNVGSPVDLAPVTAGPPVALQGLFVGPPAAPGGSDVQIQYVHTQTTPATVWTVVHDLGRRPSAVSVFNPDLSVEWVDFGIHHVDSSTLYVTADVAIAGIALVE